MIYVHYIYLSEYKINWQHLHAQSTNNLAALSVVIVRAENVNYYNFHILRSLFPPSINIHILENLHRSFVLKITVK